MVHQYKNNGYNIVLDVNSGAIHVVDDVTYDVIELFEDNSAKEIIEKLVDRYPQTEIEEAIQEVNELKDNEELFTEDTYKERIIDFKKRQTVVKALCLHIAHDCNLACRYCFAEEGEYHGRRALMSYETGKQALDFLIANSGSRRNLEVDFFGGEPLMNWDVVKQLVAYGREQEKLHDKHFRFTLTTNGVLLNDEIMEFANKEMDNVVLSIDGRKEVHDRMRPFRKGAGNIFRGLQGARKGFDRVKGDQMGMLATIINSLALQSALEDNGVKAKVLTSIRMEPIGEYYSKAKALEYLEAGYVVIIGGGTSNPYFSTDSASALRGIELEADVMLKGTRVDGVYTADPEKDPAAEKFDEITFDEVYRRNLKVMDMTAFTLCRENGLRVIVFDMDTPGNLEKVLAGEKIGTLVKL